MMDLHGSQFQVCKLINFMSFVILLMISLVDILVGDYIGLDLLMPMRTPLKYRFLVRHTYAYKSSMAIQISYDDLVWVSDTSTTNARMN